MVPRRHSRRREGQEWSLEVEGTRKCGRRNSLVVLRTRRWSWATVLLPVYCQRAKWRLAEQEETSLVSLDLFSNPNFKQYFFFLPKTTHFLKNNYVFYSAVSADVSGMSRPCPGFKKLQKQFWTLFTRVRHVSRSVGHVSVSDTCPTQIREAGGSVGASE